MDRLISQDKIYNLYEYSKEDEFEKNIVRYSKEIFGINSIHINVKKRIGEDKILSIPDGYLIAFSFERDPRLYIIENELVIGNILKDEIKRKFIEKGLKKAEYRNIDALLEDLIFEKSVAAIIVIDQITTDLENVLNQLTMKTDIIEFQTFVLNNEYIHKFTPFQQEIRLLPDKIKVEEIDTIVVPANEEGFNEVFLGQNCWYAIRISSSMIDRIKYIAGYQTAPVSAITYFAEILKIEKHKDTGKYILHFKDKAKEVGPIRLSQKKKGEAPQGPRYTTIKRLLKAKTLKDVF